MSNKEINGEEKGKLYQKTKEIMSAVLEKPRNLTNVRKNNWVFITEEQSRNYMVKFVPNDEGERLRVEAGIARMIQDKTDLPVPSVLELGEWNEYVYLFREVIQGEPLIESIKRKDSFEELLYQAGEALAKIHSIEFNEKGILNQDLEIESADVLNQLEFNGFLKILQSCQVLSKDEIEKLSNIDIDGCFARGINVLCHSDYSPNNIIVKGNKLAGIIDFEWAMAAPPMDDIASFDLFMELEGVKDHIHAYYKGYQSLRAIEDFYFKNLNLYKLYRLVTMVSYQAAAKDERFDKDRLALMKERLKEGISRI